MSKISQIIDFYRVEKNGKYVIALVIKLEKNSIKNLIFFEKKITIVVGNIFLCSIRLQSLFLSVIFQNSLFFDSHVHFHCVDNFIQIFSSTEP